MLSHFCNCHPYNGDTSPTLASKIIILRPSASSPSKPQLQSQRHQSQWQRERTLPRSCPYLCMLSTMLFPISTLAPMLNLSAANASRPSILRIAKIGTAENPRSAKRYTPRVHNRSEPDTLGCKGQCDDILRLKALDLGVN